MSIDIEDNGAPAPDVASNPDRDNPDKYDDTDDNGNSNVQV